MVQVTTVPTVTVIDVGTKAVEMPVEVISIDAVMELRGTAVPGAAAEAEVCW